MEIYLQKFVGPSNAWITFDQDKSTDPTPTYVCTSYACTNGSWGGIGSWKAVTPDGVIPTQFFTVGPKGC